MSSIKRVCKKCNCVKGIEEFQKTKNKTHLAYRYSCIECYKKCRKISNKKYYENKKKKKKEEENK